MTPDVHVSVDHRAVGVGDPFVYTVEASGTSPVRVTADSGPFAVLEAPQVTRSHDGGVETVRVSQRLICIDRGCAPGASPRTVLLPRVRVTTGDESLSSQAQVVVAPRVPGAAVAASRAPYRTQLTVPAASTPLAPGLLAGLLLAAAVALVLAAVVLVLRGRRPAEARARRPLGLRDALVLLRESAGRPVADRRRAADFAGRFADGAAREEATRVAWGPPGPEAADVGALADRIEAGAR
jgi:hypothetical protein